MLSHYLGKRRNPISQTRARLRLTASDGIGSRTPALPGGCLQRRGICGPPECVSLAGADGMELAAMNLHFIAILALLLVPFFRARASADAGTWAFTAGMSFIRTIVASQCEPGCPTLAYMGCAASPTALSVPRMGSFHWS